LGLAERKALSAIIRSLYYNPDEFLPTFSYVSQLSTHKFTYPKVAVKFFQGA